MQPSTASSEQAWSTHQGLIRPSASIHPSLTGWWPPASSEQAWSTHQGLIRPSASIRPDTRPTHVTKGSFTRACIDFCHKILPYVASVKRYDMRGDGFSLRAHRVDVPIDPRSAFQVYLGPKGQRCGLYSEKNLKKHLPCMYFKFC